MRKQLSRLIALAAMLSLLVEVSSAQQALRYRELPNFHRVTEKLYRGGQPKDGGLKKLAELGIKTIINLRGASEQTRAAQAETEAAGLRYFNIPLPNLGRPTDEQVARVMAIIDAPENWPVFIHCQRGSDRTGTIIAVYRIAKEGWTGERAQAEAKRYGMHWLQFQKKDYISDYAARQRCARWY
jgi:uncharacterized protein (TIGR01244 family)